MNLRTQLEKLHVEIADIDLKISEVEALRRQYASELEKLESGDGDVTKVVTLTVSTEAIRRTIERYAAKKDDLNAKISLVKKELKQAETIADLKRLAKFSDVTYGEIVEIKARLSQAISESVRKVMKLQGELNQAQLESRALLPSLGFSREDSKNELEAFLTGLGLRESAFRHQRLPYLHWQEVPQPVLGIEFLFQINHAINHASGALPVSNPDRISVQINEVSESSSRLERHNQIQDALNRAIDGGS